MTSLEEGLTASSLSLQFDQLTDPFRRRILVALAQNNAHEDGAFESEDFVIADNQDRHRIELVHNHLPKLDEAGFIEWDHEADRISRGARFDEIAPLVTLLDDHSEELQDGWP